MSQTIEAKRNKLASILKWVGVGVVGLVVSPFVFLTIKGLVGLAVAGLIGSIIIIFTPWVSLKLANLKYRLIDAENVAHSKKVAAAAAENPIETLAELLRSKNAAFVVFKQEVENSVAARDAFGAKVEKFAQQYPARAPEFQAQYRRMSNLIEKKKVALIEARKSLDDGAMKLEEMKAYWAMSQDVIALNQAAGMNASDAFERLKADTSCDAVFQSMHTAFAQLEVESALEENNTEIPMVDQQRTPAPDTKTLDYNPPVVDKSGWLAPKRQVRTEEQKIPGYTTTQSSNTKQFVSTPTKSSTIRPTTHSSDASFTTAMVAGVGAATIAAVALSSESSDSSHSSSSDNSSSWSSSCSSDSSSYSSSSDSGSSSSCSFD